MVGWLELRRLLFGWLGCRLGLRFAWALFGFGSRSVLGCVRACPTGARGWIKVSVGKLRLFERWCRGVAWWLRSWAEVAGSRVKVILGLAEAYRVLRVPTRAGLVQGMPGDARDTLHAEDWRQVTQQFEPGSNMYNK